MRAQPQQRRSEAVPAPRIPAPLAETPDLPHPLNMIELTALVRDRVSRAARAYRDGKPGRAEYELVRGGLAIARYTNDTEAADTLAELRFVHVPGATS